MNDSGEREEGTDHFARAESELPLRAATAGPYVAVSHRYAKSSHSSPGRTSRFAQTSSRMRIEVAVVPFSVSTVRNVVRRASRVR
jgi:hypothetical protein